MQALTFAPSNWALVLCGKRGRVTRQTVHETSLCASDWPIAAVSVLPAVVEFSLFVYSLLPAKQGVKARARAQVRLFGLGFG